MKISATSFLRENAYRFTNVNDLYNACSEQTGHTRKQVNNAWLDIQKSRNPLTLTKINPTPTTTQTPNAPRIPIKGLSEVELRQKHDLKFIIQQGASKLERGLFVSEQDFIAQANIRTQNGYRQYLDDSDFSEYKGRAGGTVYWGHPESILKMKNEGILR